MPSGLILSAIKGSGNTIVVSVSGKATNTISTTSHVNINVKGSAVAEYWATSSNAIPFQLNPSPLLSTDAFTILSGTAIANSSNNLSATATISKNQGNTGMEYIIFELINGSTPEQVQVIPFNYESDPTATKVFMAKFITTNNLTSNYSVKIHVSDSDSLTGLDLVVPNAIPLILFSQLNFDDDSYIGINDIIKFITLNSGSTDINYDGNINNEDSRILLDQISPII